jgi:hypothetical protein
MNVAEQETFDDGEGFDAAAKELLQVKGAFASWEATDAAALSIAKASMGEPDPAYADRAAAALELLAKFIMERALLHTKDDGQRECLRRAIELRGKCGDHLLDVFFGREPAGVLA